MPALAALSTETLQTKPSRFALRKSSRPVCTICSDTMVAAEASALTDNVITYLWSCETCGYGMVTKYDAKPFACA